MPDRLCAAHVQRHPADEIGEQVGLEKRQTLEHLGAILEDVLKSPKVTFSEEGWSPTVYNVRAATRPRVLVGGMEKPQIEVLEGVGGLVHFRKFSILHQPSVDRGMVHPNGIGNFPLAQAIQP